MHVHIILYVRSRRCTSGTLACKHSLPGSTVSFWAQAGSQNNQRIGGLVQYLQSHVLMHTGPETPIPTLTCCKLQPGGNFSMILHSSKGYAFLRIWLSAEPRRFACIVMSSFECLLPQTKGVSTCLEQCNS